MPATGETDIGFLAQCAEDGLSSDATVSEDELFENNETPIYKTVKTQGTTKKIASFESWPSREHHEEFIWK